jgi:hypothetical protein
MLNKVERSTSSLPYKGHTNRLRLVVVGRFVIATIGTKASKRECTKTNKVRRLMVFYLECKGVSRHNNALFEAPYK